MPSPAVQGALNRLRASADRYVNGFPNQTWTRVSGPGPDTLTQDGAGGFHGLTLEPGQDLVLACEIEAPEEVAGVRLAGDELAATMFSLYPTEIAVGGAPVFEEGGVPVAAGPCLFTVLPELEAGANPRAEMRLRVPANQTTTWFQMKLTTPGLRARFEALDVAWAQLAYADAIACVPDERARVEQAAAAVPEAVPEDEAGVADMARAVADALMPLDARAKALNVHCVGHSHIDMNWLWTWPDTVEVIKRDFRSVLALMDEFPELTFSHSQAATYELIRQEEPELFERVLERIREGRWEPISMTWVEGDVNMASGEAHARQLLEGVAYTREVLGATPTTFHSPDTFGHAGNLPQIAVSAGARRYYHHRANPGGADQWPAYWWEGQDGTRLLAISTPSYNGEIMARDLAHAAIKAAKLGYPCALHFHGIGDHGGGPSRQNIQALRRFQQTPLLPSARCSTTAAYTHELTASGVSLPCHRGESSTIFEGCYTTHADTKFYNRRGENLLTAACALLAMVGDDEPDEIREAWRTVLFNQFHDIFDGSAIHEVYEKNREDFDEVAKVADACICGAMGRFAASYSADDFVVANATGTEITDWVVLPGPDGDGLARVVQDGMTAVDGQYVEGGVGCVARIGAFTEAGMEVEGADDVAEADARPPLVVAAYAPTDGRPADTPEAAEAAPYYRVETKHYVAYVRRDCGVIVGFRDKRVNRELVAFGMRKPSDYMDTARPDLGLGVFQVTDEAPHAMTAWEIHEVRSEQSLIGGATTRIVENGPLYAALEVVHQVHSSTITETIRFYRDLPRVDFEARIEWNEAGNASDGVPGLKVAFTGSMPECEAWFETPFGAAQRPSNGQEVPALRWADVGGGKYGFAVLNDSKHGYDALGCRLRLTLLRSAYDPDAISDTGSHVVRFAFLPHPGNWRDAGVVASAAAFNVPFLVAPGAYDEMRQDDEDEDEADEVDEGAAGISVRLADAGTAVISSIKPARWGAGQVAIRIYETGGREVHGAALIVDNLRAAWHASIVEEPGAQIEAVGDSIEVTLKPWEVRTYLVEYEPEDFDDEDWDDDWDDEDDEDDEEEED